MSKKIKKPADRSEARDALNALVNKESMEMVDRMVQHMRLTLQEPQFAEKVTNGTLTAKDVVDIDIGFLVQEIAGLKVLLRGDLGKTQVEYEEVPPDTATAPLDAPKYDA